MTRLIPKSELHGQRNQLLDPYHAMEDFRQALNRPDELPGFDDLLNAMGLNRSNYMQGANQRKLIEAVRNGDWVVVKP
ncbi:iron-containing alcohol dehydrogenase [Pseudomonas brassicacearum]|uniref:iron-containing alcohol dehydrogenase n=1 Tax=Pseudomonas brassicacearum TaxID=930166 RepID=UPI0011CE7246|nr:iron-containing alcohol dehydrogenase [Pseudomonas brassicacearum]